MYQVLNIRDQFYVKVLRSYCYYSLFYWWGSKLRGGVSCILLVSSWVWANSNSKLLWAFWTCKQCSLVRDLKKSEQIFLLLLPFNLWNILSFPGGAWFLASLMVLAGPSFLYSQIGIDIPAPGLIFPKSRTIACLQCTGHFT